jgi:hypothetical protein
MNVVLPAPLGPTRLPGRTVKSTESTATTLPNATLIPRASSSGAASRAAPSCLRRSAASAAIEMGACSSVGAATTGAASVGVVLTRRNRPMSAL